MNEEKLKQINELMGNFVNSIAQRAETAKSVNDILNEQDKKTSNNDSWGSWDEEPTTQDDDVEFGGSQTSNDSKKFEQTQSTQGTQQSQKTQFDGYQTSNNSKKSEQTQSTQQSQKTQFDEEEDEVFDNNVTKEEAHAFNPDDWTKAWMQSMQATKVFFESERAKKQLEKERQSSKEPKQCDNTVMFKKNTATFNGQPFEYKVMQREVNWGTAFTKSFTMDDSITNFDKLNEKIIEDIKLAYGDLSRITDIAVISGMLIINGIQYYPLCKDKDFLNGLPFDCADYFKSGTIAEIFDFGYLYYMPYLTNLKIDSMEFITRKFAYDIGIEGKFKVPLVFKAFRNLKFFEIGDMSFVRPGKSNNTDEQEVGEIIERHSRASEIYDNYIANNADKFTGWTFNNMKTYACNRGKRGFLRYAVGTTVRTGAFVAVGVGNLALKTGSWAVKKGAKLLKKAFSDDV